MRHRILSMLDPSASSPTTTPPLLADREGESAAQCRLGPLGLAVAGGQEELRKLLCCCISRRGEMVRRRRSGGGLVEYRKRVGFCGFYTEFFLYWSSVLRSTAEIEGLIWAELEWAGVGQTRGQTLFSFSFLFTSNKFLIFFNL